MGIRFFSSHTAQNVKAAHTWAHYGWRKRLALWIERDERRNFQIGLGRRVNLETTWYTLSNGLTIMAETLSQWGGA